MSDTEFESFVMNAGPDILRFCRIITNNKEQGDELYQDAMVLLLEKRVSLKAEQNSKSYALSVAVLRKNSITWPGFTTSERGTL